MTSAAAVTSAALPMEAILLMVAAVLVFSGLWTTAVAAVVVVVEVEVAVVGVFTIVGRSDRVDFATTLVGLGNARVFTAAAGFEGCNGDDDETITGAASTAAAVAGVAGAVDEAVRGRCSNDLEETKAAATLVRRGVGDLAVVETTSSCKDRAGGREHTRRHM
jgi:hypothetical protein